MPPKVLIQPSYGKTQARRNFASTVLTEVDFRDGPLREVLSDAEYELLLMLHSDGKARFLATTHVHDNKMKRMARGDVVLFTGDNHVVGIGEISVLFRNPAAGDVMWPPDPRNGSYVNVYALLNFQQTRIPYADLRPHTEKPGSKGGDNYMGARLLEDEAATRVIDGLLITPSTELEQIAVSRGWSAGTIVDDEAHTTFTTRRSADRAGFVAERRESALVVAYKAHLTDTGDRRRQVRLKCQVGYCDLYLIPNATDGAAELIEAKSDSSHGKVREALAQLLDYVRFAPEGVDALTALFPTAPTESDISWLAGYGIGCTYRGDAGEFTHVAPSPQQVTEMRNHWRKSRDG
ncbi:hypothetical protein ACWEKT_33960 [Nocardia takedensis]